MPVSASRASSIPDHDPKAALRRWEDRNVSVTTDTVFSEVIDIPFSTWPSGAFHGQQVPEVLWPETGVCRASIYALSLAGGAISLQVIGGTGDLSDAVVISTVNPVGLGELHLPIPRDSLIQHGVERIALKVVVPSSSSIKLEASLNHNPARAH